MTKISTILFDMDGVLVNAKIWHFEALNKALIAHGHNPITPEDHAAHYDGLPTRKKLERLAIPPSAIEAINTTKQRLTLEIAQAQCSPTPHHIETLRQLKDEGYQLAVCSNSVRASVDLLMSKTQLAPYFAFTLSSEDVAAPKPHPEIYLTAIARFHSTPAETLILEDNPHGIKAALASQSHLMEIPHTDHVTHQNIHRAITSIETT